MIEALHARIDALFLKAIGEHPAAFECRPGCTACCHVDLTVFPVEAARVREAFRGLPPEVREAAAARARAGSHCAMLADDGRCVVYEARPSICRSHGLAVRVEDRVEKCPRNYRTEVPRREHVLDLERLNEALVRIDWAFGGRGERVRLADVARGIS